MSTSVKEFIRIYYRQKVKKSKSTLFNFQGDTLYIGKCTIAKLYDNLILINETVDMSEVNKLKESLIATSKEFKYNVILIPFKIGEEEMPTNEDIINRLESRLTYWLDNSTELVNNEIREQYKAYFEQFKKFLNKTSKEKINAQLQALYKQINNKEFLKALKLQVARRKSYIK